MPTSKIILPTNTFMSVAGILGQTSGGEMPGMVLYTTKGEYGEEPGEVPLLAGVSFNGTMAGHYYEAVEGGEIRPSWWSNVALGNIFSVFGPRAAEVEDHRILIEIDYEEMRVSVFEHDPSDDAPEVSFNISTVFAQGFPLEGVRRWYRDDKLTPILAQDEVEIATGASDRVLFEKGKIAQPVKLVGAWKKNLIIDYRGNRAKPAIVRAEGVPYWTGILLPSVPAEGDSLNSSPEDDTMLDFDLTKAPGYEAPPAQSVKTDDDQG